MDTLAPLPRATFREQIATALREAILAGSLAPGSVLTETMLATRFDVSISANCPSPCQRAGRSDRDRTGS